MLAAIKFSVPLWPGLSPDEINQIVVPFLADCGNLISDLYFTCRIAPFNSDAMGGIIVPEETSVVIENALEIGKHFDIPLSATFNDITISPSYKNYQTFVKNFRPLYDAGVKIVTIPFTSWLRFGLKKEFPDLFVKNTILNRVHTPSEIAVLFNEGFDYINLNRELMRDERALKEIKEAKLAMEEKLGKKLYISLLYNEHCEGNCPIHPDHYAYNLNRTIHDAAYFGGEFKDISPCIQKEGEPILYALKASTIPSYYSELNRLSEFIDVFKMHGRENKIVFYETVDIIAKFKTRELINDPYRKYLSVLDEKDRKIYLKTIRNCRFNCWKCTVCEETVEKIQTAISTPVSKTPV